MQITALNNQSLFDISIRHFGTVSAVFEIAVLNGLGITDTLEPGQKIEIPNKDFGNQEIVNYFLTNNIQPATALTVDNIETIANDNSGIDFWGIEVDFEVQ